MFAVTAKFVFRKKYIEKQRQEADFFLPFLQTHKFCDQRVYVRQYELSGEEENIGHIYSESFMYVKLSKKRGKEIKERLNIYKRYSFQLRQTLWTIYGRHAFVFSTFLFSIHR